MDKNLGRTLRAAEVKIEHAARVEFLDVRQQWYYSLAADQKAKFKDAMKAMAALAEQMQLDWGIFTKSRLSHDQWDEEGNYHGGFGANQPPQEWLKAIEIWEQTQEIEE